jgi:mannosyltransferase
MRTVTSPDIPEPVSQSGNAAPISRTTSYVVLGGILVCHAALSFHALAAKTFWFDEGVSVGIVRLDFYNLLRILWRREANMSLYYLALRLWMHFGSSPAFVRSLSVTFSVGAVAAMYLLGRRLFNSTIGLIAAALLAFNAWEIRYAQEARSYSLMVLLCILSSLFFVRYVETSSPRDRRLYVVFSTLAVYAHFYSGLLFAAQWCWLRLRDRQRANAELRQTWSRIAIFTAPVLIVIAATGAGPLNWVQRPGLTVLWKFVLDICGNGGPLLVAAYAALCLVALLTRQDAMQRWTIRLLALWIAVPIALILVVSIARPLFVPRYFFLCLPALCLLAAIGLNRMKTPLLIAPALLLLLGLCFRGDVSYYQSDFDIKRDDWRAATEFLRVNATPEDAIMFHVAMGRMPYEYYKSLDRDASTFPQVVYPNHGDKITFLDFVQKPDYNRVAQELSLHSRVWLVVAHATNGTTMDVTASSLAKLAAEDRVLEREDSFGVGLTILFFETGPGPAATRSTFPPVNR